MEIFQKKKLARERFYLRAVEEMGGKLFKSCSFLPSLG